jgi:multidrug efflux pump subunit AcrA (membrane-fusion protein)
MTPEQDRLVVERLDAIATAKAALDARRLVVRREIEAATAAIRAAHAADLEALDVALARARTDLDDTQIAIGRSSPMLGRRVACPALPARGFGQQPQAPRTGVVQSWTKGESFSGRYPPHPGQLVVRVLRKDGTPGSGTIQMTGDRLPLHWSAEEELCSSSGSSTSGPNE